MGPPLLPPDTGPVTCVLNDSKLIGAEGVKQTFRRGQSLSPGDTTERPSVEDAYGSSSLRWVQPAPRLRPDPWRLVSKKFTCAVRLSSVFYRPIAGWKSIALKPLSILILCVWHGLCCPCALETWIQRMCKASRKTRRRR